MRGTVADLLALFDVAVIEGGVSAGQCGGTGITKTAGNRFARDARFLPGEAIDAKALIALGHFVLAAWNASADAGHVAIDALAKILAADELVRTTGIVRVIEATGSSEHPDDSEREKR